LGGLQRPLILRKSKISGIAEAEFDHSASAMPHLAAVKQGSRFRAPSKAPPFSKSSLNFEV
jgi:hypothetical protein